jgi:transposase InsO family protein
MRSWSDSTASTSRRNINEQKKHQLKIIDECVQWYNEIKPHLSLNIEALETPIQAFQRKQPPKGERSETADP